VRDKVDAVLDTVIFVRCLLNPGSVWGRVVFEHRASYRLNVSGTILAEIYDVLERPAVARKFRFVAGADKQAVLDILGAARTVAVTDIPPVSRDPGDDMVLATAKAAGANYLVTEDEDLLVLGEYEGVKIVDAATFLRLLEEGRDDGG
jgi:uncharacterized protein